ncbi:MAG TPA: glutamate synthase subunit beta [Candidatus Binataceae bacterium]|nr:glutamate synthase subunit beta [Candidatus Binataceae bacterium]
MGKLGGFLEIGRETPPRRPVTERVRDWREYDTPMPEDKLKAQGARCMDCGIPFCHKGCPLGNIIPDWNDLVYRGRFEEAIERLHRTNNFPEFTGRVCPAPCEEACVLNINSQPVTIKMIEKHIIDRAFAEGWVKPVIASVRTGKKVAVVGSGPSGMACAQQLARAGHSVTLFERSDRVGGLLMYGIPDFKLEKSNLYRRVEQMTAEGVEFRTNCHVGVDYPGERLRAEFDAICLTIGSTKPRDLPVPGRELDGIHFAMQFLPLQNKINAGDIVPEGRMISAKGKRVVILGGGDTGSDCLGTSNRQGAVSVHQFELLAKPPEMRTADMPWPNWPMILRTSTSHEEGVIRDWSINTKSFAGHNGRVEALHGVRLDWKTDNGRMVMEEIPGSEFVLECDLVLLALGFLGPEPESVVAQLGLKLDQRGNIECNGSYMSSVPGVFAAGDARRGQSLVVWAIWEGREAARCVDQYLMGESALPSNPQI